VRAVMNVILLVTLGACSPRESRTPTSSGSAPLDAAELDAIPLDAPLLDAAPVTSLTPDPALPVDGTPCERACLRAYTCAAHNEYPIHAHCIRTCDGSRVAELERLATAACTDVAATLAAGGAPIEHARCVDLVAARGGRAEPATRRAALIAHPWCAPAGGPLESGPLHFEDDARLWGPTQQSCWTVDARRVWWSADGVDWQSATLRISPRALVVDKQRLMPCPEPPPEPPEQELDQDTSKIR
jgi:hypothetical protein